MAVKSYKVKEDKKYTGKHRVYVAGEVFPESEIFGSAEKAVQNGVIEIVKADEAKKTGK